MSIFCCGIASILFNQESLTKPPLHHQLHDVVSLNISVCYCICWQKNPKLTEEINTIIKMVKKTGKNMQSMFCKCKGITVCRCLGWLLPETAVRWEAWLPYSSYYALGKRREATDRFFGFLGGLGLYNCTRIWGPELGVAGALAGEMSGLVM